MFISWFIIIVAIIIIASIAGSGKNSLRRRVRELEDRVEELETELEENQNNDYSDHLNIGDN